MIVRTSPGFATVVGVKHKRVVTVDGVVDEGHWWVADEGQLLYRACR